MRAFEDVLAICISSWSLLSLSMYATAVVWCFVRVDWRATVSWNVVRKQLARALAWCGAALSERQRSGESPADAAVHILVQQRNRDFIRRALFVLAPLLSMNNVFEIYDPFGIIGHPKHSHIIVMAILPAMAALCVFHEGQPGKAVMIVAHFIGFLSLLVGLYSYPTGLAMIFDRTTVLGIRIGFAMSVCDIRLTLVCNTAYGACMIHKLIEFVSNGDEDATFWLAGMVHQELSTIVGLVVLHNVFLWRLESSARSTVEAKMSANFIAGLKKLLRTSYDVVVELSDDLAFTDDSRDLAGVLLCDPSRSLKGSRITDLMACDVDKEAFSEHVKRASFDSESQCRAIPRNFHMRDSCSNLLCMEMWHTRFEDLDSRLRHLIGIKELVNHEQAAPPQGDIPNPTNFLQSTGIQELANHEQASLPQGQSSRPTNSNTRHSGAARQRRARQRRPHSQTQVSDDEQPREGHIVEDAPQQHAEQGQAQPPNHADRMRNGEDSDCSSASSTTNRSRRYVVEGFRRTSAHAQKTSILNLMRSWNVALGSRGCCAYHAIINEISNTAKWLARRPCRRFDLCDSQAKLWQCHNCGILVVVADPVMRVCHLCNTDNMGTCTMYGL